MAHNRAGARYSCKLGWNKAVTLCLQRLDEVIEEGGDFADLRLKLDLCYWGDREKALAMSKHGETAADPDVDEL